jgi:hypothetical protein
MQLLDPWTEGNDALSVLRTGVASLRSCEWKGGKLIRRTKAVKASLLAASMAMASLGAVAQPAEAETFSSRITRDVGLYDCTSTSTLCTTKVTQAYAGNAARMVCWEDGRSADGQTRWFYMRLSNGRQGFVPASRVWPQITVKSCRDRNASNEIDGVIAARWALGRNGQVAVPAADQTLLSNLYRVSATFTRGDWSGDCIAFTNLAWYSAGTTVPLRNARQVYDHYRGLGRIKTDRNPPRGALVFWNAYSGSTNYGHVEVSLGNSRSIGTQGWDGNRLPVSIAGIGATNYLGWAMP